MTRHDECSGVVAMEPDTSKKGIIHYVQMDLPTDLFAVIRMQWRSKFGVETVDEVKLIDEGTDTIEGFAELMAKAIEGGAEVAIICPYDPQHVGLDEE